MLSVIMLSVVMLSVVAPLVNYEEKNVAKTAPVSRVIATQLQT
jgi:hypothetical protein